jgi:hypothetical protein
MSKVSRVGALVLCFVYKLYFAPFKRNSAVLGTHSLLKTRSAPLSHTAILRILFSDYAAMSRKKQRVMSGWFHVDLSFSRR